MISLNFSSDVFLIRSGYITETGVKKHTYDVFYHNTPQSTSFLYLIVNTRLLPPGGMERYFLSQKHRKYEQAAIS